ncbi:MAG: carbon monoxide dehydrogenase, partial [Thermodesulfobacteriota bacterium]
RDEHLVLDMEAGVEHLGRGTARAVDRLIVVVEPGRRSLDTAVHIRDLAKDLGIKRLALVGNKIRGQRDKDFLTQTLPEFEFLGFLPFDEQVIEADLAAASPYDRDSALKAEVGRILERLLDSSGG